MDEVTCLDRKRTPVAGDKNRFQSQESLLRGVNSEATTRAVL